MQTYDVYNKQSNDVYWSHLKTLHSLMIFFYLVVLGGILVLQKDSLSLEVEIETLGPMYSEGVLIFVTQ